MKLKKIASLALAGVMAVSMLAGCSNAAQPENPVPETPVATDVVTYANDVLSATQKAVFEFKSGADLDAATKAVVTDGTKFSSATIDQYDAAYNAQRVTALETEVGKKLGDDVVASLATVSKKGTQKQVFVYAVSGNLEEKAAVEMVVSEFAKLINKTNFPSVYGKYTCDYSANISAMKVTSPDNAEKTVWVVSAVVAQTAVETANAQ